ncbi:MAG: CAP domain-containing protein, partial [Candidatus Geothermincolia bacterium]
MDSFVHLMLLAAILAGAALGCRGGSFRAAAGLLGLLVMPRIATLVMRALPLPVEMADAGGGPLTLLGLVIFLLVLGALLGPLLAAVSFVEHRVAGELPEIQRFDLYRPAGTLLGAINGFLVFSLAFLTFAGIPGPDSALLASVADSVAQTGGSIMGLPALKEVSWNEPLLTQLVTERDATDYQYPKNLGEITLDPELEAEMIEMVNRERTERGLPRVRYNETLTRMARAHCMDMIERRYFAHESPEGDDVGDRADDAGLRYMTVGENLAISADLASAHRGLMESPGHLENILHYDYGRIGIGVYRVEKLGVVIAQNYAD